MCQISLCLLASSLIPPLFFRFRLQTASNLAVDVLIKNLKCGIPAIDIRSAQTILQAGFKGIEWIEVYEGQDAALMKNETGRAQLATDIFKGYCPANPHKADAEKLCHLGRQIGVKDTILMEFARKKVPDSGAVVDAVLNIRPTYCGVALER